MLTRAILLQRYKRFLADVRTEDGTELTVHCPNPGAMTGLATPGATVWLRPANKGAKLPYRWQMVDVGTSLVGVDTGLTNSIVAEALQQRRIPALAHYSQIQPEVSLSTLGEAKADMAMAADPRLARTRLDFCLSDGTQQYFLEVKSVTLRDDTRAYALFPDSRTARGLKHLHSAIALREYGFGAGILYVVQRSDCTHFAVATEIDHHYANGYTQAIRAGVDIMAWDCVLCPQAGVRLEQPISIAKTHHLSTVSESS